MAARASKYGIDTTGTRLHKDNIKRLRRGQLNFVAEHCTDRTYTDINWEYQLLEKDCVVLH